MWKSPPPKGKGEIFYSERILNIRQALQRTQGPLGTRTLALFKGIPKSKVEGENDTASLGIG